MSKPRVYIAGPYSSGDVAVNVQQAILAGNAIAEADGVPFIPHLTHFWHLLCPHSWSFWLEQDLAWLEQCHALLRLPGESTGATREAAKARELGLPVFTRLTDCLLWLHRKDASPND